MKQRLQKIIAASGYCSRRKAETLIEAKRVKVDGVVAELGAQYDPLQITVEIDGKPIGSAEQFCYVLLHKPIGAVTTMHDPDGRPLVTDLLKRVPARVFPVGRLDINTSGLLLLTNDGQLANRLAHPRHEIDKTYLVRVRGELTDGAVKALTQGVRLDDIMTTPAVVKNVRKRGQSTWFELTIHEGRNRQVRRMCEALGYQVSRLSRIKYAFLDLGTLAPGEYRMLSAAEVELLKQL